MILIHSTRGTSRCTTTVWKSTDQELFTRSLIIAFYSQNDGDRKLVERTALDTKNRGHIPEWFTDASICDLRNHTERVAKAFVIFQLLSSDIAFANLFIFISAKNISNRIKFSWDHFLDNTSPIGVVSDTLFQRPVCRSEGAHYIKILR